MITATGPQISTGRDVLGILNIRFDNASFDVKYVYMHGDGSCL